MSAAVKESAFVPLLISILLVVASVNSAIISESWSSTKFEELILKHTWVVNHFDQLYTLEYVNSPEFWPANYEDFKWYIRLYPRYGKKWEPTVSLQLYHNHSSTVNVNYTFSIGNVAQSGSNVFEGVDSSGFSYFMSRNAVYEQIQPNGDLIIKCEIRLPTRILIDTGSGRTSNASVSVDNQNCAKKIHNDFADLLEDEKYSDVTIVVEGSQIRAHRNILAVRSPVFASLLVNSGTDAANCNCNSSSIEIKDVKPEVFRKLLRYVYTNEVDGIGSKMAKDLLVAAVKYDIRGLKATCGEILCSNMSGVNAVEILVIADQHKMSELKLCASKFIAEHV